VLQPAIALGFITGEHYAGFWTDIGTVERLKKIVIPS
jgi:NDP-sugar pyrophosphorylase family protein